MTAFNQHTDLKTAAYTREDTSKADKKSVLINWSADEITLIVANSAFGLGVNKSYVRCVIHLLECQTIWNHGCKRLEQKAEMETTVFVCSPVCYEIDHIILYVSQSYIVKELH